MSLPYLPLFIDDYEAATAHLSLLEDGAYNRLLRLCWRSPGCKIPGDEAWVMRKMRATTKAEIDAIKSVLGEFFTVGRGKVWSKRLLEVYLQKSVAHTERVKAGKRGAAAKYRKTNEISPSNAIAKLKQPEPEPEPYISNIVADAPKRLNGAFDLFWAEFPKKVGKTAARRNFDRVVKAGADPNEVIAGATRYAAQVAGKEHGFVKHPQGWLTDGRWSDEAPAHIPQQSAEAGDRTSFLRKIAGARP